MILGVLLMCSAFFSGCETGMMSLNKYRLKHLAKTNNKAKRIASLLAKPDRLLGVILIGNNFVNIAASSLATIISVKIFGDAGVKIAIVSMTVIVLIFAEITPKTLAAVKPELFAYACYWPLFGLLWLLFPLVWLVNFISNGILRIIGVKSAKSSLDPLNLEEIRTIVSDASGYIPPQHQKMITSFLDLEKITVDDIMIPRNEIIGIDINHASDIIVNNLLNTKHTLIPVYRGEINQIIGILHSKDVGRILESGKFDILELRKALLPAYFIPEGTSLQIQLLQFQSHNERIGLVVDEYGDIQGLVSIADILEEIIGDFNISTTSLKNDINIQSNGDVIIDGTASIRDINRALCWDLPTNDVKTISGLITSYLGYIPAEKTCLRLDDTYKIEILEVRGNIVKTVKFYQVGIESTDS